MNPTNPTTPTSPDPLEQKPVETNQQTPPTTPASEPSTPAKTQPWLLPLAIVLIIVALGVGAWMYFANKDSVAKAETPTASVTVTDNGFSPATIKIQKGQDVTWTNDGHTPLQVVGDQKSTGLQPNEAINPGETYSFTFDDSGTFYYHDSSNLNHKGIVIVE